MASYEIMTPLASSQDEDYDRTDAGSDHIDHQNLPFSRLSMCSRSISGDWDDDDDDDGQYMSRLSMEGSDADAEVELSDGKGLPEHSSDSEKEPLASWFTLPGSPWRRRRGAAMSSEVKDYASENDCRNVGFLRRGTRRNWRTSDSRSVRNDGGRSFSGESGAGGGVVMITRPRGGRRPLCMDLEEVKACRDLGFELEHERMVELTCSGGDSPIADCRISSPGDDPRDVKARLKVWARAVALASAARQCST